MANRDAGAGGELGRVLDRARPTRGRVWKQPVDYARLLRGGRVEGGRVGDQVQALGEPDQARQPLRAARSRDQPEIYLGKADLIRALGGEPQVACERQLETAAQAVPSDRRYEHERCVLHLSKGLVREKREHETRARAPGGEHGNVGPGREEPLRSAGHNDGRLDAQVDARIVDRARELTKERVVVAVGGRPVEHYDSDAAFLLEPN